jgi:phosphonate transport system substrate-binding protein
MCELNPQVGRELRVLTNSPNLVPSAFLFRSGFPAAEQEACLKEFTHAHLSVMGQQILTVFQTERLEERPASVLDSALELLQRHQDLLNAASERKELPATIRPSAGKTSQATSGNGVAAAPAHQSVNR